MRSSAKKRIFISSSREAVSDLKTIARWLEAEGMEPVRWDDPGQFPPGGYVLSRLIEISKEIDGAVLIFTPDDHVRYREKRAEQPRDNILLEYGLFVATLGQGGAVICQRGGPKIASDLYGIISIDLERENNAQIELAKWAHGVSNRFAPKTRTAGEPRVAMHCSETEEIKSNDTLRASLKSFYRKFLEELFRARVNINICGSEPFRTVIYEFYCEHFLMSGRDRRFMEKNADRIRWYWQPGSPTMPGPPPIFEARETRDAVERTWAEADDADLVVAVCGKSGTIQQVEMILGKFGVLSPDREKPVIVLGWFGGQLYSFLQQKHSSSQERRIIRSFGEIDFSCVQPDWPDRTAELATLLANAIVQVLSTRKSHSARKARTSSFRE